ncbi:methyl-accepting chemotaxis protein [Thermovenabulum gondwanense]|uniref:Putative sensory transducer protein YfmS n=1 Tax=Thermovenabulum gondwanense TaxID=520767 RepID=A0A162N4J6_9FIRM|nr:methyl-accepting chemotaxis protein [Thermovenabulum gondwanense]KYO69289.1 putative sensory transducer protein YfmS [Thermovenabulum gondwanense]
MQTQIEKKSLLDTLIEVTPIFLNLFPFDCNISITDTECFLANYSKGEFRLDQQKGKKIPENSRLWKVIETGEIQKYILPKEVYGVPFKSISVPVKDETGKVIGCIALGMSLKNQERLEQAIKTLSGTSEEVVASAEELAASARELSKCMEIVDSMKKEMEEQINKTEEILNFIKNIAMNSNILGINAAIEAARAGKEGLGFNIIADEIRKMSRSSADSVKNIEKITEEIKQKMSKISNEIQKTFELAKNQAFTSEEITAAIEELNKLITDLESISKIV